ncbi:MAG: serine protease [Candidatus Micrarchaeota archaeon]
MISRPCGPAREEPASAPREAGGLRRIFESWRANRIAIERAGERPEEPRKDTPGKRRWPRLRRIAFGALLGTALAVGLQSDHGSFGPGPVLAHFGSREGLTETIMSDRGGRGADGMCSGGSAERLLRRISGEAEEARRRCVIEQLTHSNVRIESGGVGAGIIIQSSEERSLILTAWHVPSGASSVTIQNDGKTFDAERIYLAPGGIDMALIEVRGNVGPAARISSRTPWQGMNVVVVGSPLGGNDITTFGRIIGFGGATAGGVQFTALLTDAAINPGNSGGGVYDLDTGELLGVVVSKPMLSPIQMAEGMGLVIPASILRQIPVESWAEAAPPAGWREADYNH